MCDCKNCRVVARAKQQMLAIHVAGRSYDDGDVMVWNDTVRDYPCLKKEVPSDPGAR